MRSWERLRSEEIAIRAAGAESNKRLIDELKLSEGTLVTYVGGVKYVVVGFTKSYHVKIRPAEGGKMVFVNPLSLTILQS